MNSLIKTVSLQFIKNIQSLANGSYKYVHGLSPTILREVFEDNESIPYDLRMHNQLYPRFLKRVRHGTEAISFLSPKIWPLVLHNRNESSSWTCFKKDILANGNQTAHVLYAKYFCNVLVLYCSITVLPSRFLIYFKFILPVYVQITICQ